MSKRKRALKTAIFIACEGKNTERLYFEAISEEDLTAEKFAITVYPDDSTEDPTTHALGLVREAKSRTPEFDECWAVFDRDGYTKHAETFEEASSMYTGAIVNIAFSSISFEQWVLLHFRRSADVYPKSKDIIAELHNRHFYEGYEKTTYQHTYATLKDKTEVALENAAWLRHHLTCNGILPQTPVYEVNPYTDIDVLVRRLLLIDEEITWVSEAEVTAFNSLRFIYNVTSDQELTVTITNNGGHAIVFNAGNIEEHTYLFDEERRRTLLRIDRTVIIAPGTAERFILTAENSFKGMTFNFKHGNKRVMAEL